MSESISQNPHQSLHTIQEIERTFAELFDILFRYVRIRVPSAQEAEDIVGDVFAYALRYAYTFIPQKGTLRMWLFGIARHEIMRYWKKQSRKDVQSEAVASLLSDQGMFVACMEQSLESEGYLARLNDTERALVVRHYIDGIPYAELARDTGKTSSALRKYMSRIVQSLRARSS